MKITDRVGVALLAVLSIGSVVGEEGKYPEFSWDRVPVSVHFGIGAGLEPEQSDLLAKRFDFVTLTAGRLPRSDEGSAETYTADAAREIKERNPKAKVLFYWASDKPKHQSKISNGAYPGDYLIHEKRQKGGKTQRTEYFDLSRKEVQEWWSDVAAKAVTEYGCDGIFVDGATAGRPGGSVSAAFGAEKAAAMDAGTFAMLKEARKKMGADKMIVFNPLHGSDGERKPLGQEYLPVTDGAMIDDFDRLRVQSVEYMASTIESMREASKDGKIIVFKGWPRFLGDWRAGKMKKTPREEVLGAAQKDLTFSLACFLAGAGPNCYFCYSWGWNPEDGSLDWYPEFDRRLGPPKGDAVREGDVYRREFEHASVMVDLEKRVGEIEWRE